MEPSSGATSRQRRFDRWVEAARDWWLARGRRERWVVVASALVILVAVAAVVGLGAAALTNEPSPRIPAVVVGPSTSVVAATPSASTAVPSASASVSPASTPEPAVQAAWALPQGWRHELVCGDENRACRLHLYDETGHEASGWPVAIPGQCDDDVVAVGPNTTSFLACTVDGRVIVSGLRRDGGVLKGWPVKLRGDLAPTIWNDFGFGSDGQRIQVGPDGTVFLAIDASRRGTFAIHGLAPNGSARPGWPVALAGDARGFTLARDGTVVAWWYEGAQLELGVSARRTVFTMIGPKGRALPGWPRGSAGAASGPIVQPDGTLYYVSASGKVWGHDRAGKVIDGWPYQLPEPVAPDIRADGSLIFVSERRVMVLDRHGRVVPGWPYETTGSFLNPGCDTPSWPTPMAATRRDGSLALASWDDTRSTVVVLAPDGRTVAGWPYRVPVGWRVTGLEIGADDTVAASVSGDSCGGSLDSTTVRISRYGALVGEPPGTPLNRVYESLRLDGLRTTDGRHTYVQGDDVTFEFRLVNRSNEPVKLPRLYIDDDLAGGAPRYGAGFAQTWIDMPGYLSGFVCRSPELKKNLWYSLGGQDGVTSDQVTIPAGEAMPIAFTSRLPAQLTECLMPGDYRVHIDYLPVGVAPDDDPLDENSIDFTIVAPEAPAATPSPMPSPPASGAPAPTPTQSPRPS